MLDKIKKGYKNPSYIPPYLRQQIRRTLAENFPNSRWGRYGKDNIIKEEDYVTFRNLGPDEKPVLTANIYFEVTKLEEILEGIVELPMEKSLEIGCGYGRVSPWIAEFSEEAYAVEPNKNMLQSARAQYENINFTQGTIQSAQFDDNTFDFMLTMDVLQHVPPEEINGAIGRIQDIAKENGIVIILESTSGEYVDTPTWTRSPTEYANLLQMELLQRHPKPVSPLVDGSGRREDQEFLVFRNE